MHAGGRSTQKGTLLFPGGEEALLPWHNGGTKRVESAINTKAAAKRVQANKTEKR